MKKRNNKKKRVRFNVGTSHPQIKRKVIDMKPEDLAAYVHHAEKEALPTIKDLEISAGAAILLLAQYTQALITGDPRLTLESATSITDSVIALWQIGSYQPGSEYPFTLEETLLDLKNNMRAQNDYSKCFQPFTPIQPLPPRGVGQIAGGIVQHPKTHLWQIWMILDGPCEFLGAYCDASTSQKALEEVVNTTRQGKGPEFAETLYQKITSKGDGEPQQIPFDMMVYLLDHIEFYMIEL
jgi:hypothetical protein